MCVCVGGGRGSNIGAGGIRPSRIYGKKGPGRFLFNFPTWAIGLNPLLVSASAACHLSLNIF